LIIGASLEVVVSAEPAAVVAASAEVIVASAKVIATEVAVASIVAIARADGGECRD
jgi:hypothetical protein